MRLKQKQKQKKKKPFSSLCPPLALSSGVSGGAGLLAGGRHPWGSTHGEEPTGDASRQGCQPKFAKPRLGLLLHGEKPSSTTARRGSASPSSNHSLLVTLRPRADKWRRVYRTFFSPTQLEKFLLGIQRLVAQSHPLPTSLTEPGASQQLGSGASPARSQALLRGAARHAWMLALLSPARTCRTVPAGTELAPTLHLLTPTGLPQVVPVGVRCGGKACSCLHAEWRARCAHPQQKSAALNRGPPCSYIWTASVKILPVHLFLKGFFLLLCVC